MTVACAAAPQYRSFARLLIPRADAFVLFTCQKVIIMQKNWKHTTWFGFAHRHLSELQGISVRCLLSACTAVAGGTCRCEAYVALALTELYPSTQQAQMAKTTCILLCMCTNLRACIPALAHELMHMENAQMYTQTLAHVPHPWPYKPSYNGLRKLECMQHIHIQISMYTNIRSRYGTWVNCAALSLPSKTCCSNVDKRTAFA